jgi:hypothetical protein
MSGGRLKLSIFRRSIPEQTVSTFATGPFPWCVDTSERLPVVSDLTVPGGPDEGRASL